MQSYTALSYRNKDYRQTGCTYASKVYRPKVTETTAPTRFEGIEQIKPHVFRSADFRISWMDANRAYLSHEGRSYRVTMDGNSFSLEAQNADLGWERLDHCPLAFGQFIIRTNALYLESAIEWGCDRDGTPDHTCGSIDGRDFYQDHEATTWLLTSKGKWIADVYGPSNRYFAAIERAQEMNRPAASAEEEAIAYDSLGFPAA